MRICYGFGPRMDHPKSVSCKDAADEKNIVFWIFLFLSL